MRHLHIRHTNPLEREFEAWVIAGMEEYFESLGIRYSVFAVSPTIEKYWPADERVLTNGKVFGLQFKQAKLSGSGRPLPAQLHWSFHRPRGQLVQVLGSREVFYCLPTFVNRDYRKQALQHCVFWRPDPATKNCNAWYKNPLAKTLQRSVFNAPRWGLFIEQVLECDLGRKVSSGEQLAAYVNELRESHAYGESYAEPAEQESGYEGEGLYVVALSLES